MTDIAAMLNTYPGKPSPLAEDALVLCLQECLNCTQVCVACADACLADPDRAALANCASMALDCADLCGVTMRVVSRQTAFDPVLLRAVLTACVEACRACYEECRRHALDHEHCRICADACHRCSHACRELLASVG